MYKKIRELNRLNTELDAKVNECNQKVFTDMICYIRGADISDYDQEVVRQDLLEMILSAQERGENIDVVIGDDYKVFCDNVIASLPPKSPKQKIIDFFNVVCWCLAILCTINIVMAKETIELIKNAISGQPLNFNIAVSAGDILSFGIIIVVACIIVVSITKNAFKEDKSSAVNIVKAFVIGFAAVAVIALVAQLGKRVLFTVNIFVACVAVIVLYTGHKILERL